MLVYLGLGAVSALLLSYLGLAVWIWHIKAPRLGDDWLVSDDDLRRNMEMRRTR